MFTLTDKKSMIIQALMISPELRAFVSTHLDLKANDTKLIAECLIKVEESLELFTHISPIEIASDVTPTLVFERFFKED